MDQRKIDGCVELLSRQGCAEVRRIIAALEDGAGFAELAGLSGQEREAVLRELKSVMAVYDGRK